jgi:outer membrane protein assembly factor BamE (lipoprotein component of BamABCDE complex)
MNIQMLVRAVLIPLGWRGAMSLVLLANLLAGCASPGRLLSQSAIQQLHEGQSLDDVVRIFGEPDEVLKGFEKRTLLRYRRFDVPVGADVGGITPPGRDDAKVRTLSILLNQDLQIAKFLFHESKPNLSRTTGRLGNAIGLTQLAKIEPQKTTRQELIGLLGAPFAEELTLYGSHKLVWVYADYMLTGMQGQGLEVLLDENDRVASLQQTKYDSRR